MGPTFLVSLRFQALPYHDADLTLISIGEPLIVELLKVAEL